MPARVWIAATIVIVLGGALGGAARMKPPGAITASGGWGGRAGRGTAELATAATYQRWRTNRCARL